MNQTAVLDQLGLVAKPVTANIGADIEGIDLSSELCSQTIDWLREQLVTYKVLFFRDQDLSPQEQADFGRRFGQLEVHPIDPHFPGVPEVTVFEFGEERKP